MRSDFKRSGTLVYMAPEVLLGKGSIYQSDMYALAAIFGELFGASNVLKYKESVFSKYNKDHAQRVANLITTSYCFDGLFTGYDVYEADPNLLEDIKTLITRLHSSKPEWRPTIDQVNKFLITLLARMDYYKIFNDDWAVMATRFEEFEAYHQQINLVQTKHRLSKFKSNLFSGIVPSNHAFNLAILQRREAIYQEIATLISPSSHYQLSERLIKENRRVDFDDVDRPYPDLKNAIQMLEKDNLKLKRALASFNDCVDVMINGKQFTDKFIKTNSTGMIKIGEILKSKESTLDKLQKLQQIGQAKTEKGFFYFFSHSKIFGKGRHENIEKLYQKIDAINPEREQEEYCAESQLDEITQFIESTSSFTH
ncbi:MAG: protein kinase domain-containing protein [Legionella sp.]